MQLRIRSFEQLAFDHAEYLVAAHLNESLLAQETVAAIVAHHRIKRKSIDSVLRMQNTGNQFRVGRRGKVHLVCHVLDYSRGQISGPELQDAVEKMVRVSDHRSAIVAEGFQVFRDGKTDPFYSFSLLCRYLNRFEYSGLVYEPPQLAADPGMEAEERITNTRMIIRDGQVDATLAPILRDLASFRAR